MDIRAFGAVALAASAIAIVSFFLNPLWMQAATLFDAAPLLGGMGGTGIGLAAICCPAKAR